jgi:hypothetical protein
MGFTAAMMGGTVGFGIQMFSNAIRKIPLSRGTKNVFLNLPQESSLNPPGTH